VCVVCILSGRPTYFVNVILCYSADTIHMSVMRFNVLPVELGQHGEV